MVCGGYEGRCLVGGSGSGSIRYRNGERRGDRFSRCDLTERWREQQTLNGCSDSGDGNALVGASSYTFAETAWTQSLPDWIALYVNLLTYMGGVPRQIVSDRLRAGINRACSYEPLINRTYADMAWHYGTAVSPARPYDRAWPCRFTYPRVK